MQVGKFTLAQLVSASVMDKAKIKFGFWGGAIAIVLYAALRALAVSSMMNQGTSAALDILANATLGFVLSVVMLGLMFSISGSFGGKKKAGSLWKLGLSKLIPLLGVMLLYVIALVAIVLVEYGLFLLGGLPLVGPLALGVLAFPLVIFNIVVIVLAALGTKLLTACLVTEKGSIWTVFVNLNKKLLANFVRLVTNTAVLALTTALFGTVLFGLFIAGFSSVSLVNRLVLQQIVLSGGLIEWPFIAFSVLVSVSLAAAGILAVTYLTVYALAGLYSVYLSLDKK